MLSYLQVEVEQQYQQLCEAWKAELDEKQHQFEQARAQILEPRCGTAKTSA
jgi:L-lactate utilization protein LutC